MTLEAIMKSEKLGYEEALIVFQQVREDLEAARAPLAVVAPKHRARAPAKKKT